MHKCSGKLPDDICGPAIKACTEIPRAPGEFWVSNGEYSSQVLYCPYCGAKAPKAPAIEPFDWWDVKTDDAGGQPLPEPPSVP